MPDDTAPKLIPIRPANSPNAFDLRRVGAHPDFWYAVAWSRRTEAGQDARSAFRR